MYDMHMGSLVRTAFHITTEQKRILESFKELPVAEHIRRAIDDYIEKKNLHNVSTSPSQKGVGHE
jgi:hypothetical protein